MLTTVIAPGHMLVFSMQSSDDCWLLLWSQTKRCWFCSACACVCVCVCTTMRPRDTSVLSWMVCLPSSAWYSVSNQQNLICEKYKWSSRVSKFYPQLHVHTHNVSTWCRFCLYYFLCVSISTPCKSCWSGTDKVLIRIESICSKKRSFLAECCLQLCIWCLIIMFLQAIKIDLKKRPSLFSLPHLQHGSEPSIGCLFPTNVGSHHCSSARSKVKANSHR